MNGQTTGSLCAKVAGGTGSSGCSNRIYVWFDESPCVEVSVHRVHKTDDVVLAEPPFAIAFLSMFIRIVLPSLRKARALLRHKRRSGTCRA